LESTFRGVVQLLLKELAMENLTRHVEEIACTCRQYLIDWRGSVTSSNCGGIYEKRK
jgi:hypothetical protein